MRIVSSTNQLHGKTCGFSGYMENQNKTLEECVKDVLGGIAAISEEGYIDAVHEIAERVGRNPDDTKLWDEVHEILATLPCPID